MIQPQSVTATDWQEAVRPRRRIGHAIEVHGAIASTNDRARELLDLAGGDGGVVIAEEQTAGRGRRGRTWLSPPGLNLLASVALRPRLPARDAWQLGLAAALAAADACGPATTVALKWPNDLVAVGDGRKLGGLLIETMVADDRLDGAVIGIGINANWRRAAMPDEIREEATSLADVGTATVDRVALLSRLLDGLDREIVAIEDGHSPIERYRSRCATLGARVAVATADGEVRGRAVDLDAAGGLVVVTQDGGRHVLASGEVVQLRPERGR